MIDFWKILIRAGVSFVVLLFFTRILGKKQLKQFTVFNYIAGVSIGSMAGDISTDIRIPLLNGLMSIAWWSTFTFLLGYIALKSTRARTLVDGEPTIVIKKGQIIEKALQPLHINIDDLTMLLREQGVFSVKNVHYAIMEPNGNLSVLQKQEELPVTKKDVSLPIRDPIFLPTEVVSDGKILHKNLQELNKSESWLLAQLRKRGIISIENIYYAEIQADGMLYMDRKEDQQ